MGQGPPLLDDVSAFLKGRLKTETCVTFISCSRGWYMEGKSCGSLRLSTARASWHVGEGGDPSASPNWSVCMGFVPPAHNGPLLQSGYLFKVGGSYSNMKEGELL